MFESIFSSHTQLPFLLSQLKFPVFFVNVIGNLTKFELWFVNILGKPVENFVKTYSPKFIAETISKNLLIDVS